MGTLAPLQPMSRVLLDMSHSLEQIACQQCYASRLLRAPVAMGLSLGCACSKNEAIRGVEMSISHCQHVDVNVKKLTKI